jgi:Flp pilus assembly pilin Flp
MAGLRSKRGQSTLEYIIILTAIVAAIIVVANTVVKDKVTGIFTHVSTEAENAANKIKF